MSSDALVQVHCDCTVADRCPNGRTGNQPRCVIMQIRDPFRGHIQDGESSAERKALSSDIPDVKPGTLPIDIDETLVALRTQYQIRGDAIVPRASADAPTIRQMGIIRDAHLNIYPIILALKNKG